MPSASESSIIRVSGGYVDSSGKFWPTGQGILQGNTGGGGSSSWQLGKDWLSGWSLTNPSPAGAETNAAYTSPTVTQTSSSVSSASAPSSLAGNDAFDQERNAAEQYGVGMVWAVQLPNLVPDINNQVTVGGGGGTIIQSLRSPGFWLQVLVVLVGGLTLFWLTGKRQ